MTLGPAKDAPNPVQRWITCRAPAEVGALIFAAAAAIVIILFSFVWPGYNERVLPFAFWSGVVVFVGVSIGLRIAWHGRDRREEEIIYLPWWPTRGDER